MSARPRLSAEERRRRNREHMRARRAGQPRRCVRCHTPLLRRRVRHCGACTPGAPRWLEREECEPVAVARLALYQGA